jgi:hypothetical protein
MTVFDQNPVKTVGKSELGVSIWHKCFKVYVGLIYAMKSAISLIGSGDGKEKLVAPHSHIIVSEIM